MAEKALAAEEDRWAKDHPVPESSVAGDLLMLWNYPIAKSDLSTVHKNAIERFLGENWIGPSHSRIEITVLGHASDTGDPKLNKSLAGARAQGVERFLRGHGFNPKRIFVDSAGSAEPYDKDATGLAFAKNRRVDLTTFTPALPEPRLPPVEIPGQQETTVPGPTETSPSEPGVLAAPWVDLSLSIPLPPVVTSEIIINPKFQLNLKARVVILKGKWGGGLAYENGKVSAKIEVVLAEWFKAKIAFTPSGTDGMPKLKIGGELSTLPFRPEVGVENLVIPYVTLTCHEGKLTDISLLGTLISLKGEMKIHGQIYPGKAMIARGARMAAALRTAAATVTVAGAVSAGALVGATATSALALGGTYLAIEQAKEDAITFVRLLARRDGAGSRVAWEIIGNDDAEVPYKNRRAEWRLQISMVDEFEKGRAQVDAILYPLKEANQREENRKAWTDKFASNGGLDFTEIRERVFQSIGGYSKDGNPDEVAEGL